MTILISSPLFRLRARCITTTCTFAFSNDQLQPVVYGFYPWRLLSKSKYRWNMYKYLESQTKKICINMVNPIYKSLWKSTGWFLSMFIVPKRVFNEHTHKTVLSITIQFKRIIVSRITKYTLVGNGRMCTERLPVIFISWYVFILFRPVPTQLHLKASWRTEIAGVDDYSKSFIYTCKQWIHPMPSERWKQNLEYTWFDVFRIHWIVSIRATWWVYSLEFTCNEW